MIVWIIVGKDVIIVERNGNTVEKDGNFRVGKNGSTAERDGSAVGKEEATVEKIANIVKTGGNTVVESNVGKAEIGAILGHQEGLLRKELFIEKRKIKEKMNMIGIITITIEMNVIADL